jgi:hypothetical protein
LSRASTSEPLRSDIDVDGRNKSGHDATRGLRRPPIAAISGVRAPFV